MLGTQSTMNTHLGLENIWLYLGEQAVHTENTKEHLHAEPKI